MENIFVEFLPPWVETGIQPAFYDKESGTVLQQTARMYARVNMLIRMFNKLSKNTKEEVESFERSVNETVDEYIEKFNELHDYVEDYFENLDVQEEINNKLDAMVEAGTLQEIITAYIQTQAVWCFDNVADMQASTNLINGSYAQTLGYYTKGDGGGATYKITDTQPSGKYETLGALYAELIVEKDVNVKQFGAKGDGTTDDTQALRDAIAYAKTNNLTVTSPKDAIYLIKNELDVSNTNFDFNHATIKTDVATDMLVVNTVNYYTYIKNVTLDMNSIAQKGIDIINGRKCYIEDVNLVNVTTYGIYYASGYEIYTNNVNITGTALGTSSIGIYCGSSDSYWDNIVIIDLHTAIYQGNNSLNFFNNIHAWLLSSALVADSAMFKFDTSLKAVLNNCYSDTYFYTFYIQNGSPKLEINNFVCLYAPYVMTADTMSAIGDNPYLFYLGTNGGDGLIRINNIDYSGLVISATPYTGHLSNKSYFNGEIVNATILNLDKSIGYNTIDTSNRTAGITVEEESLEKVSNIAKFTARYSVDATSVKTFTIGNIPWYFRPTRDINTNCLYGGLWAPNSNAYLYVTTGGNITVTLPDSATGTQRIKIDLDYIVPNSRL